VLLAGILQGAEHPGSVAASCHVLTANGVTACGSQFPPTVGKHCQHQHSATHKITQQYETPTIAAVVIFKVLLPQSNTMAAFVRSYSSLVSDVCPDLPTCNNHNIRTLNFHSVQPLPADPPTLMPKMSKCQHTAVHLISQCLTAMC